MGQTRAATQNNLGTALRTLGERDGGTARLEEAVVAYRAALEERTRERVPLVWAKSLGNPGVAMMRLAERKNDPAMARTALGQINSAHEALQSSGHGPLADFYRGQIAAAKALVERLGGDPFAVNGA